MLREINTEYSFGGLLLKLQYFDHPDVKSWLIGKDPDAGEDWGQKRREQLMVAWLDSIIDSADDRMVR